MRADIKGSPLPDGWTIWTLNGVAALMPGRKDTWSEALLVAYDRRVEANLTGLCACGATSNVTAVAPAQARGVMVHGSKCPAGDDIIKPLLTKEGWA